MRPRIAVIQFPGVNCEYETARALETAGMAARILRWNIAGSVVSQFDGFVLPGGFSYEDRVRAGAIAAAEDVMENLIAEASKGKPVVGICNGAQILVEAGLVPGLSAGSIDLALAPNQGMGRDGYYANWVYVKVAADPKPNAVTYDLEPGQILPIPIAHAQGRFTSSISGLMERLDESGQIVLKYCTAQGEEPSGFPEDPNGSARLAAAVSNVQGNVVAMMPHPERAAYLRQVPFDMANPWSAGKVKEWGSWETMEGDGPGAGILQSLGSYIRERLW
jgi:phosphoribosylformylglycinamidine synthase I